MTPTKVYKIKSNKKLNSCATMLFVTILVATSCMKARTSDSKTYKKFKKANVHVSVHRIPFVQKEIRYIKSGIQDTTKPLILFVHGAPGSSDAFYDYLMDTNLVQKAQMISLDRLGYGYSDFGNAEKNISVHADVLHTILMNERYSSLVLVGHSYGGPIICEYAAKYPTKNLSLLLLAPALDPSHEKIFKIAYLGKWAPTRLFTPKSLKVATDEKFSHVESLQSIVGKFSRVSNTIYHLHGDKDPIVPIENLDFAKSVFPEESFTGVKLADKNHFLPWNSKPIVVDYINLLLSEE